LPNKNVTFLLIRIAIDGPAHSGDSVGGMPLPRIEAGIFAEPVNPLPRASRPPCLPRPRLSAKVASQ
jgi:hypothetical protein